MKRESGTSYARTPKRLASPPIRAAAHLCMILASLRRLCQQRQGSGGARLLPTEGLRPNPVDRGWRRDRLATEPPSCRAQPLDQHPHRILDQRLEGVEKLGPDSAVDGAMIRRQGAG